MRIAACPDPDCGAPAEITPLAVAASTSGPVPHVRTLCVNKHRYLLPDTWVRSHNTRPVPGPSATTTTDPSRPIRLEKIDANPWPWSGQVGPDRRQAVSRSLTAVPLRSPFG
jgi:hypothetical protein